LRTIADVGLVGLPNAGKPSLLAALSNAKPEIASYPLTTLSPNLGVVTRGVDERLTLADIPGIIEDAHLGKGLGLDFLRHISRTRLLTFVLDIAEEPAPTMQLLLEELKQYDPDLLELPALIVLNKTDLAAPDEVAAHEAELTGVGLPVIPVSALEGNGLDAVRDTLFQLLPERPVLQAAKAEPKVVRAGITVNAAADGSGWIASGPDLEAVVVRFDAANREAVAYMHHHFRGLGLDRLLKRAGARDGDDVWIGDVAFEYFDETGETLREEAREREREEPTGLEADFSDENDHAEPDQDA